MAVLCAPKQKKWCHVGWNSHATELYSDYSDICPASQPHHHQSWSFPATRGVGSSIKQRVVHLPVLPHKKQTNSGGTANHIPLDYDNNTLPYSYHLDPQAYALAMARDMEDAATVPHKQVYTYNPLVSFSSHIDTYLAESLRCEGQGDALSLTVLELLVRAVISSTGTVLEPHIVVTVATLEQFQMLTFMGKLSAYEHYHSLVRLSDNTGTKTPLDNFEALICIVREWSFIRLLKRGGISNNTNGWEAAKPVSCAVECLARPPPGINIPVKLDPNAPMAWEDTLFVGVDANFKLERFEVSSEEKDPGLGQVLCYFVDTKSFKDHLFNFDKRIIQPWSTCNDHEAAKGDKKTWARSRALAASGVSGVVCMCHELKLPLSTVDLRVGEMEVFIGFCDQQVEMDYGYLSAVRRFSGVPQIVTTYDIACQWLINLEDCIKVYGPNMAPPLCNMLYLVPKFHLPGHIKACQEKYCMSFHIHVGNNDGKAPEWSWAISNGVAASTQEMSPGHRCEKLDQHFSDVNWQKNISMGMDTVPNAAEFESHFERFKTTLPTDDVAKWTTMVEAWEADRDIQMSVTILLAREDAQDELAGLEGNQLYVMSPKDMIAQGVQIEASQRRIARMNKDLGEHSTDLQRAQVLEKSNWLCRRVESWFVQQEVHMLVIHGLQIRDSEGNGPSVPLTHNPYTSHQQYYSTTHRFDLLHTIRGHLLALAKGYKDADAMMLMQKEWLKCHKTTRDLNTHITQAKYYYRNVQQCLMTLLARTGEHSWQSQLRGLEDSDVRRISDSAVGAFNMEQGMSWIWYAAHLGDVPGGVNEYLRIEWCKARTWAHHWREESELNLGWREGR
ncbi:hypothetical protein IW261DRAFT_1426997 [Armillaria novae-zelandiae]|uniref:CxC2-like cysteine cluster KDZ transposase-associated domain-containing protein n=1 Tax=Armillaria novae-zelandiae TaxID=153914 RepID=A0AA39NI32_9AGAR|nr:hypothetical protein IW261DRAFT_1426997 [Armillaria novae-zelandiae]